MAKPPPPPLIPAPMREQMEDAAIDCKSVTFKDESSQVIFIERVAYQVAGLFRRVATIKISGKDVTVSFMMAVA